MRKIFVLLVVDIFNILISYLLQTASSNVRKKDPEK